MVTEFFSSRKMGQLLAWKVKEGSYVDKGHVIFDFVEEQDNKTLKYRATNTGVVSRILLKKGEIIPTGCALLLLEECSHPTVITDLCAVCGIDFRQLEEAKPTGTSVSMIHTVPDLKCSIKEAQEISKTEETRLLRQRKLHLLVDLDQTLIHTTNMDVPPFVNDVFHFRLGGSPLTYHTRLRPGTRGFLEKMSELYELHICTFGSRNYAHSIARHLDPQGKYFYIRILSRDECFSQNSKTPNLQDLFPSGDHMVCIIDDREDVWNFTPNLVHVKPYHFFSKTGDINAPPALSKREDDNKTGFDFSGGRVKQLSPDTREDEECKEQKKAKVAETDTDSTTPPEGRKSQSEERNQDLSSDLLLTDESDTTEKEPSDSSSSSQETEVSTPKPDVPHVFDEEPNQSDTAIISSQPNIQEGPCPESRRKEDTVKVREEKVQVREEKEEVKEEKEEVKEEKENEEVKEENEQVKEEKDQVNEKTEKDVSELNDQDKTYLLPDADDYLLYLEEILERIHKAFYTEYDRILKNDDKSLPSVKEIIPALRRKVLKGCSLVFSGVVPVGAKLECSRAYGVALALGARVYDKFVPPSKGSEASTSKEGQSQPTSHVVAARMGTAKTNEARRYKGVHIVTPDWLWSCAERWEHVDERLFALAKKSTVRRHPPPHLASHSPLHSDHSSEGTIDDDILAQKKSAKCQITEDRKAGARSFPNERVSENGVVVGRRVRTLSGRFMDTINPLMSFSMDEIADMDHEVDDICALSASSSDDEPPRASVTRRKKSRASLSVDNRRPTYPNKKSSSSDSSDDESSCERLRRKRDLPRPETEPEEEESLFTKFRRGEPLPSDAEMLNLTNPTSEEETETFDQENEWMARQLEAELLGIDDSSQSHSYDGS